MSVARDIAVGAPDEAAYVERALSHLWPADGGLPTTMLALPSRAAPRLLVRPAPARVSARAVRALTSDRSVRSILRREVVAAGLRVGAGSLLARRHGFTVGAGGIDAYLADLLGTPVHVAMSIGPPRANRKPVLAVLRPDGEVIAYAKVGLDDLPRVLVRHEAGALRRLADAMLTSVTVPHLLHGGRWNGVDLLVQSALPTARARPVAPDRLIAAGREIAAIHAGRCELASSPAWHRMSRTLADLSGPRAGVLRHHAAEVERQFGTRVVDVGTWHGDWTPWNVVATPDAVLAWDWERFAQGVPVGYDALHHHVQEGAVGRRIREIAPWLAGSAARVLAPYGVEPASAAAVTSAYLLEIGSRYVADGQDVAGPRLGRIEDWLLPALTTFGEGHARQSTGRDGP